MHGVSFFNCYFSRVLGTLWTFKTFLLDRTLQQYLSSFTKRDILHPFNIVNLIYLYLGH
jgi:hypothetical protein